MAAVMMERLISSGDCDGAAPANAIKAFVSFVVKDLELVPA